MALLLRKAMESCDVTGAMYTIPSQSMVVCCGPGSTNSHISGISVHSVLVRHRRVAGSAAGKAGRHYGRNIAFERLGNRRKAVQSP